MSKGVSQVATMAIYVGISLTAVSGAVTVGAPALENMQDANSIRKAQTFMQTVDRNVQQVVSEGKGSTRTMEVNFDRGQLYYDNTTNSLVYELQTDAQVISPQSSRREGNVVLSSSADVSVYPAKIENNGNVDKVSKENADCYMMENQHIRACIRKVGDSENPKSIDTSDLVQRYEFKNDEGSNKQFDGNITVELNEVDSTSYGTGFTTVDETGDFIGTGEVKATVSSDYGFTYDVFYRLPTGADFLKVDVQNFR